LVAKYVGVSSLPPEDTGQHDATFLRMWQSKLRDLLQHLQKLRELGKSTSGLVCELHSVAKFHFHR
jgi:hypothetical protein